MYFSDKLRSVLLRTIFHNLSAMPLKLPASSHTFSEHVALIPLLIFLCRFGKEAFLENC